MSRMPRDYRKLRVFNEADDLVLEIYRVTASFPSDERFGLTSQLRRAAFSVPNNIAEGSGRRSEKEFVQFVNCAVGSAYEVRYLLRLAWRLKMLPTVEHDALTPQYDDVIRGLTNLMRAFEPQQRRPGRRVYRQIEPDPHTLSDES